MRSQKHLAIIALLFIIVMAKAEGPSIDGKKDKSDSCRIGISPCTICNIRMRRDIKAIRKAIGASYIKKYYYLAEGASQEGYHLYFGDHYVDYEEPFIVIKDPFFITKEGIGVGSRVEEFSKHYGTATLYGPGPCLLIESQKPDYFIIVCCSMKAPSYPESKKYARFKVRKICILLPAYGR